MLIATSVLTHSVAVVAPALSILQCLAQALHIHREGAEGVSLGTWILSVFVAEIWTGYGFVFHVPAELYSNAPFLAVASVVVVVAARHQDKVVSAAVRYGAMTALAVLGSFIGLSHQGRLILATLAVVSAVVIYLPQLVVTLRSSQLEGVSVISWIVALVTSVAWGLYGILIHQPPVALPSIVMIPSSLVILIQVSRHRLRVRAPEEGFAAVIE